MIEDIKEKVFTSMVMGVSFVMMGTVNLSEIWALIDEIVAHTSSIIGLVIMGVTISIAVFIGVFIKKLLSNASNVK